jgi:hypothetical protein
MLCPGGTVEVLVVEVETPFESLIGDMPLALKHVNHAG